MKYDFKAYFKILRVDQPNGSIDVQFFDPFGPIVQGELDPDVDSEKTAYSDQIVAIDIPFHPDGTYWSAEEMVERIAEFYPYEFFIQKYKAKTSTPREDLEQLAGKSFIVDLQKQSL